MTTCLSAALVSVVGSVSVSVLYVLACVVEDFLHALTGDALAVIGVCCIEASLGSEYLRVTVRSLDGMTSAIECFGCSCTTCDGVSSFDFAVGAFEASVPG